MIALNVFSHGAFYERGHQHHDPYLASLTDQKCSLTDTGNGTGTHTRPGHKPSPAPGIIASIELALTINHSIADTRNIIYSWVCGIWWTRQADIFTEIATIMDLPAADTNTLEWFLLRSVLLFPFLFTLLRITKRLTFSMLLPSSFHSTARLTNHLDDYSLHPHFSYKLYYSAMDLLL